MPTPQKNRSRLFLAWALACVGTFSLTGPLAAQNTSATKAGGQYDVVVYSATSGGVAAAIQTARMGKTVVLIEPGKHIGGLTSGGLGATDIGNKGAIGGISREFYRRIGQHYSQPGAWKWQKRESYGANPNVAGGELEMWKFEPHVAENIYRDMLKEAKVPVVFGERLDLKTGVQKEGQKITAIVMESGATFTGKMFIDASYEGDLMAKAGVSYHVGREANSVYGETLNGVQTKNAIHHQFIKPVDPYIKPGDPTSGLLPGINPDPLPPDGTGDKKVQAYNFRMCTTDVPENRRAWTKPADYDPQWYELVLRNCEAGDHRIPWNPIFMPNRKTDTNNNFAISTDFIGQNYDYPEADYATRDKIFKAHVSWQMGLMWTLANHPRVPEKVREHFQRLGLAKDEFTDNDNWPHQMYVREARRMISDYVMTQHNCQGRRTVDDAVGLAAYTMDSHNIQRHVKDGRVLNEGDVQVGGFPPYPISYKSIVPRASECSNLFVPVCLSASHISYGSIRMEPVFMVLGQSSATAACFALDDKTTVQQVDYAKLKERLLADKQILVWTGGGSKSPLHVDRDPKKLPGIVVDDTDAERQGEWTLSSSTAGYIGAGYYHDHDMGKGEKSARYKIVLDKPGTYEVRLAYTPLANRATNVPVTIVAADGERKITLNQKAGMQKDGFTSLGKFRFEKQAVITISNAGTNGHVILDAVQLLPVID